MRKRKARKERAVRMKYSCAKCGAGATKEPLLAQKDWKKMKPPVGLGGWRCQGACGRGIKVVRTAIKLEVQEITGTALEAQRKAA